MECLPRPYNISDITDPPREDLEALYERTRNLALGVCHGRSCGDRPCRMDSGAWCLSGRTNETGPTDLPKGHHAAQPGFVQGLDQLLRVRTPAGTTYHSVADFGAGVGQLGRALLERDPKHRYRAYDGSGNVESWTNGFVRFADITTPLRLPRAHWVVTTEAGEHIPNELEAVFIRNLHAHNCLGIVFSWSALNQGGHGHINNHDPLYMRTLFEDLDYVFDARRTVQLLVATGVANATSCIEQMFQPPSRRFFPCATLQVLSRRRPLRGAACMNGQDTGERVCGLCFNGRAGVD